MAKQTGIPGRLIVDDAGGTPRTITNDVNSIGLSTPRGVQDVTGLDKAGIERLLLRADGQLTINGAGLNPAVNQAHDVFKSVPSTSVIRTVTYDPSGIGTGAPRLTMEMMFSDYAVNVGADGAITWVATGQLADGTAPTWITVP